MPHWVGFHPVAYGWLRSAAKTPNWQVKDDATRMIVFVRENGKFRRSASNAHSSGDVERSVK